MEALARLLKVQGNLGIQTDPNEAFLRPLADKVALGLMDRLGAEIHEAETNPNYSSSYQAQWMSEWQQQVIDG